jgi:uncharacterized protein Usg
LGNRLYQSNFQGNNYLAVLCSKTVEGVSRYQTTVHLFLLEAERFYFLGTFVQVVLPTMGSTGRYVWVNPNLLTMNSLFPLIASVLTHDAESLDHEPFIEARIPSDLNTGLHGSFSRLEEFLEFYQTKYAGYLHHDKVTQPKPKMVVSAIMIDGNTHKIVIPEKSIKADKSSNQTSYGPLASFESFVLKSPLGNRAYQLEATDHLGAKRRWLAILAQKENKKQQLEVDIDLIEVGYVYQNVASYGHHPYSSNNALRKGVIPHMAELIDQNLAEVIIQKVLMLDAGSHQPNLKWTN